MTAPSPAPARTDRGTPISALFAKLWWLDPGEWLGPVFHREINSQVRRPATFATRGTFVLLIAAAVWIAYTAAKPGEYMFANRVATLQAVQRVAPTVTATLIVLQASLLVFLAPGMTAGAISDERRKRTLDVLLTSPVRPWQIVIGKLSAGVLSLVILSLCTLPVILAVRIFGGVAAEWVLAGMCVSLSVATLAAACSRMNSLWCKKSSTASFLGLVMVAASMFIPGAIASLLLAASGGGAPAGFGFTLLGCLAPFAIATIVFEIVGGMGGAPFNTSTIWLVCSLYNLACAGIVVFFTTMILRRIMVRLAAGSTSDVVAIGRVARAAPTVAGLAPNAAAGAPDHERHTFKGVLRKVSREVSDRPVLWRELHQPLFKRGWVGALALLGLFLFFAWAHLISYSTDGQVGQMMPGITLSIILLLQTASLTVGGIVGERETKTWDVLLTTPLTGRQIVVGKFFGALRTLWLLPTAIFANLILAGILPGRMHGVILLHLPLILLGPIALIAATGTWISVTARNTRGAATQNTLLAIFLCSGPLLLAGLMELFKDFSQVTQRLSTLFDAYTYGAFGVNPVYMLVTALDGAYRASPDSWRSQNASDYPVHPDGRGDGVFIFSLAVVVAFALYVLAAYGVLHLAGKKLDRVRNRLG